VGGSRGAMEQTASWKLHDRTPQQTFLAVIQFKEDKLHGSGGTHAEENCIQDFGGEACRKEITWKPQA